MSSTKITRDRNVVFVQLRLDPAMAETLRVAGKREGRQLPAEIAHRLQASVGGDLAVAGMAETVGALAARIRRATGYTTEADRPKLLALTALVVPALLERMGADGSGLTRDARAIAKAIAEAIAKGRG